MSEQRATPQLEAATAFLNRFHNDWNLEPPTEPEKLEFHNTVEADLTKRIAGLMPRALGCNPAPWTLEQVGTRYSDIFDYHILSPNPDAGKEGVSYAGKYLMIASLDDRDAAELIIRAVNSHDALVKALSDLLWHFPCGHKKPMDGCAGKHRHRYL